MHRVQEQDSAEAIASTDGTGFDRRSFLGAGAAAAATTAMVPAALAQTQGAPIAPEPSRYPYDVWQVLDDRFKKYIVGNTPLRREWTGALWAEGPAWNGVGRYVVFSDIPNNRQLRWDEVTGEVTPFRMPANFSNGNTFDFEGRQISCEHSTGNVVRYEYEGDPTILASEFDGKPLNAPNDVVVHPDDGGIIFTDPGYGAHWWYEGRVRELQLPTSVYHIDARGGKVTKLTDEIHKPNGLCFSPDYGTLYVADTAVVMGPPGEKAKIIAWDVQDSGRRLTNRQEFAVLETAGFHDGIRADVDGNVWAGTGFGGEGVDGVHVYAPDGTKIGQILMPEGTANLCFIGPHRTRLFMTSSQSVYTLYTHAQGAHIT